ncbi:UNVERIFIED_CONTAM: hypothetical protein HDU68_004090 [Siphonaria sp. JEL0065]|nr:hypothetical protein HDU68_004090 [Siphonaria sp. JEL0065]
METDRVAQLALLRVEFSQPSALPIRGRAVDLANGRHTSRNPTTTVQIISKDSPSLWNTSVNQGWSTPEEDILCKALMKFGVGNWRAILDSNCLPGKNPAQMYLQTQRILGQQSISEFTGLHVDCRAIGTFNKSRIDVVRKNRLITNAGVKLTREELSKKVKLNKEK